MWGVATASWPRPTFVRAGSRRGVAMVATQPSDVLACGSGQEHFGRVLHEPVDLPTPLDGRVPDWAFVVGPVLHDAFGPVARFRHGKPPRPGAPCITLYCVGSGHPPSRGGVEWLHLPGKVRDL